MNEMFPDESRASDVRRLNLLWHSVLPGAAVIVMLALYGWVQTSAYSPPVLDESLAAYLPMIFGAALVCGSVLAVFLKSRLPDFVARNPADRPFQRVSTAMFTLLGAADAPAFIGFGVYLMNPVDWVALTIIFYAFAAGIIFKPDFHALLSIKEQDVASLQ